MFSNLALYVINARKILTKLLNSAEVQLVKSTFFIDYRWALQFYIKTRKTCAPEDAHRDSTPPRGHVLPLSTIMFSSYHKPLIKCLVTNIRLLL